MFRFVGQEGSVGQWLSSFMGIVFTYFAPVQTLILIVLEFIAIDFVIGVVASRVRAKRAGKLEEWGFESDKAWHTVWKAVLTIIGIVLTSHIDTYIFTFFDLHLTNVFCGFVCGVEFWSFLENSACISNHPIFKWLKKFMGAKVREGLNIDPKDLDDASKGIAPDDASKEITPDDPKGKDSGDSDK